jgi:exopolysaccharide biosynthesis protein
MRQTTLEYLEQERAQVAVNAHFFEPFPSTEAAAFLIGLAVSEGRMYSEFETPKQSYALVADAPAINIDKRNGAAVVRRTDDRAGLWNAVSGSAQIVTAGVATVPVYRDEGHPEGRLTAGGPGGYSNRDSWYERVNARTAIAIAEGGKTLVIFAVDRGGGSLGLTVTEVARLLIADYGADEALNLDGGGSTTLAMEDAETHAGRIVNVPADGPKGRAVASNLAVFVGAK